VAPSLHDLPAKEKPMSTLGFKRSVSGIALSAVVLLSTVAMPEAARAQSSVADFYRGKTINFYIGFSAGGAYDLYARLVSRFIGKHIPGNPTIVPNNMTGGGGRVAMGYIYRVAPKDGLALGTADQSLVLQQAVGDPSIQFDFGKILWIGNPVADNNTVAALASTGVKTVDDARSKEIVVGATGPNTSYQVPAAMNAILHTRFHIVSGYPGGNDVNLAMEKGEVEARFNAWSAWKSTHADWLRDKKINILVQVGISKAPDLDAPLLTDFATNDDDRAALRFFSGPPALGRPIFTTPGVPADRLAALRKAFDDTMADPSFLAEAKTGGFDINPVRGEQMQQVVSDILASPKSVIDRIAPIMKGGN
jgi:tripartite-type tricarboxylate transporter receptor subunit TctC